MNQTKVFSIAFLLFVFCSVNLSAQKIEETLFAKFCDQVEKLNQYSLIKEGISGTILIIDPVSGGFDIRYGNPSPDLVNFKKRQKNEQIEILKSISLPITPLKDTVYIIDSSLVFSHSLTHKAGNTHFKTIRQSFSQGSQTQVGIDKITLDGNNLIITIYFPNSEKSASLIFNVTGAAFMANKNYLFNSKDSKSRN